MKFLSRLDGFGSLCFAGFVLKLHSSLARQRAANWVVPEGTISMIGMALLVWFVSVPVG